MRIYDYLHKRLNRLTPVAADCGRLCDAACCKGSDDTGMYLFPGEKAHIKLSEGMEIHKSDFEYAPGLYADILTCKSKCARECRPLACRIFPLVPFFDGRLSVIYDPRGFRMCPFVQAGDAGMLSADFKAAVLEVSELLFKFSDGRKFIKSLSLILDDEIQIQRRFGCGRDYKAIN